MRTAYTCPVLMAITCLWLKVRGKRASWQESDGVYRVIVPVASHGYEASCLFPRWLILFEWRLWGTVPGVYLRKWLGM